MSIPAILAPAFVQVALTFFLLIWMGSARVAAVRRGEASIPTGPPREAAWPERIKRIADAYHNQLELPILLYALVPMAVLTRKADLLFVIMAWVFVASRLAHAYIHVTYNRTLHRFRAFLFGAATLATMWVIFAVRILFGL